MIIAKFVYLISYQIQLIIMFSFPILAFSNLNSDTLYYMVGLSIKLESNFNCLLMLICMIDG